MRSPYQFIVRPMKGKRYDNTKDIGDVEFIISSSQEDHTVSNRFAEVVSTPLAYKGPIKKGDTLLVHHNVFKFFYNMYGIQKSGKSYFKEDLFFIDPDQFFLFNDGKQWHAHGKYCFVKPVGNKEDFFLFTGIKEEPLVGTIKYINQELIDKGLKVGDQIGFQPDSEYEFTVEDEKLYRMFTNNITMLL
jgi:hypothetical protein